jgi:hypothetical protein
MPHNSVWHFTPCIEIDSTYSTVMVFTNSENLEEILCIKTFHVEFPMSRASCGLRGHLAWWVQRTLNNWTHYGPEMESLMCRLEKKVFTFSDHIS